MSELFYSCLLGNPEIRSVIRTHCLEIEWSSKLASLVVDYMLHEDREGKAPSPIELRGYLINQGCIEEEAYKIIRNVVECCALDEKGIKNVILEFEEFYKSKRLEEVLKNSGGDASKIIEGVKDISAIVVQTTPVEVLGEMDIDDAMEEVGVEDIIPTSFEFIRRASPWAGYLRGQVAQIVAPPGTLKSLFLANEAVTALKNGYEIYWIALGDMMRLDFIIRMTTIITGEDYYNVSTNPKKYYSDEVKKLLKGLRISVLPAGAIGMLSIAELISTKVSTEKSFDIFMLDYDSNVQRSNESMYLEGEALYNTLSLLSRPENQEKFRVVFVASQPKIQYWELEELPKESAGESSKKQAVLDIMITGGKAQSVRGVGAGILKAAKVRRGKENEKSPYKISSCGIIEEIDYQQYSLLKTSSS